MTRDFRPAPSEPDRSEAADALARPTRLAIDYDDGNPATVAAPARRRMAAPTQPVADTTPATPLASVPRDAALDYDDGNPATIVCA